MINAILSRIFLRGCTNFKLPKLENLYLDRKKSFLPLKEESNLVFNSLFVFQLRSYSQTVICLRSEGWQTIRNSISLDKFGAYSYRTLTRCLSSHCQGKKEAANFFQAPTTTPNSPLYSSISSVSVLQPIKRFL